MSQFFLSLMLLSLFSGHAIQVNHGGSELAATELAKESAEESTIESTEVVSSVPLEIQSLKNDGNAKHLGVCSLNYQVIKRQAHSQKLFTQGLELHQGHFFESSGLYKKSFWVHYPHKNTDAPDQLKFTKKRLSRKYFAEGLSFYQDKLYLLTWETERLLVIDPSSKKIINQHKFSGQGWGLALIKDSKDPLFIRSDGSNTLYHHKPDDFQLSDTQVLDNCQGCRLNELEYSQGLLWANDWQTPFIYAIDLERNRVIGKLDAAELVRHAHNQMDSPQSLNNKEHVLNGIAYDAKDNIFWLTGKRWPELFGVKIDLEVCLQLAKSDLPSNQQIDK